MRKFFSSVLGGSGGTAIPYNIGEPYSSSWGAWTHARGTNKEDQAPVSVFAFTSTGPQDARLAAARNGVKRLRTLRHPNVLSFLHSTEVEAVEGGVTKTTIYVVTEPVMPLADKARELRLEGQQRDQYFSWGLYGISKAVAFLANDCKLVHGNVCVASVVVTPQLDWKLHAFDCLAEFDGANPAAEGPMLPYDWLIGTQYKPVELAKSDWATLRRAPAWSIDAWGLGCLIYELFSGATLVRTEDLRNTTPLPKTLLPDYQKLLSSQPARRLNPSKLSENSAFFANQLVETIHFMEVLNLKDSVDKDSFFRKLPALVEALPQPVVQRKLLPLLAKGLEFGAAAAPAITALLKMGAALPQDEFATTVLPTVVKLFASPDRGIRVSLLQHLDSYAGSLSAQVVDEQVFPHVATGFGDSSAFLRELTLKSMLTLAPKLSQRTLGTILLKHLSKLQVDEEAAIRTNTTILLGNIASHLNEATRKRVLVNAFTVRALRDTFPPARAAGIMALTATSSYYDVTEVATRVLPSLVVLSIDPDSDVRTKAFETSETFLAVIKAHFHQLETGDTGAAAAPAVGGGASGASLLGWAVSSLALNKGPGSAPVGAPSTAAPAAPEALVRSSPASAAPEAARVQPPVRTPEPSRAAPAVTADAGDGWDAQDADAGVAGDDDADGWADMDDEEEDVAPPRAIGGTSSSSRPAPSRSTPVSSFDAPAPTRKPPPVSRSQVGSMGSGASKADVDEDPWALLSGTAAKPAGVPAARPRPPSSGGQHVSLDSVLKKGAGRGGAMKLGAQRVSK